MVGSICGIVWTERMTGDEGADKDDELACLERDIE